MPSKRASPKFVTREGKLLFFGDAICRSHDRLMAAMYPLIDALPESWPDVLQLIRDRRHRYSGEVQFTLLNFIPWDLPDKPRAELLNEVHEFLMNVPTDAGRSVWLCGDQLTHW